jgi:hypothetical protein
MPLRDHFEPPLSQNRHWQNLLSAWANALRDALNTHLLRLGYFAEVICDAPARGGEHSWAPPKPPFTAALEFTHPDLFEVQVYREEGGPRLVAAVELVSPANKDRDAHRRVFAIKCASYLQAGLGVAIIDVVTSRTGNLHADLLHTLRVPEDESRLGESKLYAAAYRNAPRDQTLGLEYWGEPLAVGSGLPTPPLWISPDLCLPLNLEQAYERACASSRIED